MTPTPVPLDHVILSSFNDGEGMLVDLKKKNYFQLNETAVLIWQCLGKKLYLEEVVNELVSTYDVSPEHASVSIKKLLDQLSAQGLVK